MPQCPKCATDLNEDYGMATCPRCAAMLIIDMDGIAHFGGDAPPENEQDLSLPAVSDQEPEPELKPEAGVELPLIQADSFDAPNESFEPFPDLNLASSAPVEEVGYLDAGPDIDHSAYSGSSFGPADDPLGLNEYANSELSLAKDGLLVFRILISGIDTKEIRTSLREAMQDARFNWDAARLLSGIKDGALRIDNVTPVKAMILVNRIKRLPLRIKWEQYAITQVENGDV